MNPFGNNHARYEALVTEHLDGRLDAAGEAALREHLTTCAECAAEVREQQAVLSVLRAQPMVAVPRSFALPYTPRVLVPAESRISRLLRSMQVATAAAALVLVFLVGFNVVAGASTLSPDSDGYEALRTAGAESERDAATPDKSFTGTAEDLGAPPQSFAPNAESAPNDDVTALTPPQTSSEPRTESDGGRPAMEWALIIMSGLTGVLALSVVAATWLPRKPI
jgi:hypothetical protein